MSGQQHDAKWVRSFERDLQSILARWDLIGVYESEDDADNAPPGEYDSWAMPLLSRLIRGATDADVRKYLGDQVVGLIGGAEDLVTPSLIEEIRIRWEAAR